MDYVLTNGRKDMWSLDTTNEESRYKRSHSCEHVFAWWRYLFAWWWQIKQQVRYKVSTRVLPISCRDGPTVEYSYWHEIKINGTGPWFMVEAGEYGILVRILHGWEIFATQVTWWKPVLTSIGCCIVVQMHDASDHPIAHIYGYRTSFCDDTCMDILSSNTLVRHINRNSP